MTNRPWITVLIATYNSEGRLLEIMNCLKRQKFPANWQTMEVLAVDGGSTDGTVSVAAELGMRVIGNPFGDAIHAKHIGVINAKSRLVCTLDHDELLVSDTSLLDRFNLFQTQPELRAAISSGYSFDAEDSACNIYASEYGDPVSLVAYNSPNSNEHRLHSFSRKMKKCTETNEALLLEAGSEQCPLLCELVAGSGTVDRDFYLATFPELMDNASLIPQMYYLLGSDQARIDQIAIMKHDPVIHDSVESWSHVRKKVRWRISNAVYNTDIASSGLTGRSSETSTLYEPTRVKIKFFFYCLLLIPSVLDGIKLSLRWRRVGMLYHVCLTYYVLLSTLRQNSTKLLKGRELQRRYGQ